MASLYRTYRPRTFDDVVGQEHVVRTLRNAIAEDRVAHAYLFSGPRGTGKTSLAKILAKALNCEHGPHASGCETCERIHGAMSLDVIELDAASHRGIDDIREIRERVAQHPVEGRYKVYILDEAHSLTADASNALLKTLEEPPSHVVFVLCTTDPTRLLPTIRSRCQRFAFSRPGPGELVRVLRRVCDAEGIDAPEATLHLIARSAGGSFRDALTTLDQLAASCGGTIGVEEAARLLGLVPEEALGQIVDLLAAGDAGGVLRRIDELDEAGQDLGGLLQALLDHLRLLYLLQHTGALPASEAVAPDRLEDLARQARALPASETIRAIDLLAQALRDVRDGSEPRLPLELALVKAARPQTDRALDGLLARVERLEHGTPAAAAAPAPTVAPAESPPPPPAPPAAAEREREPVAAPAPPAAVAAADELTAIADAWPEVVASLAGPARGTLTGSEPVALADGRLTVAVNPVLLPSADRFGEQVGSAVAATCAVRVVPTFVAAARGGGTADEPAAAAPSPEPDPMPERELVARLADTLNATEVSE